MVYGNTEARGTGIKRARFGLIFAALAGGALGGCAIPFFGGDDESQLDVFQATSKKYCYRTLADVDCYAEAQLGEEARRMDWFDAPGYPR